MRLTVNHVRDTRNAVDLRKVLSGTREQVTDSPERRGADDLNGETIASYDIDPGDTIEAVVCALLLVPLSITCVVIIGALRAVSGR